MQQVDAAFIVGLVDGHVIMTDLVVDAVSRPPHRGGYIVARLQLGDTVSHLHHPPEALVANDEEIIAGRSAAIFSRVDLLVGTVDSNLENLDKNSTPVGNCIYRWFFKFRQVNTIRLARDYGDRLQSESSFKDC